MYDGQGNRIDGKVVAKNPARLQSKSTQQPLLPKPVEQIVTYINKPGSALESLIPAWVVQFKDGCGCKDYSKKMDRWGTEGCESRQDEIIEHLMQQSDKLIPIFRGLPDSFRKAAAKKLLAKAIAMSQK